MLPNLPVKKVPAFRWARRLPVLSSATHAAAFPSSFHPLPQAEQTPVDVHAVHAGLMSEQDLQAVSTFVEDVHVLVAHAEQMPSVKK